MKTRLLKADLTGLQYRFFCHTGVVLAIKSMRINMSKFSGDLILPRRSLVLVYELTSHHRTMVRVGISFFSRLKICVKISVGKTRLDDVNYQPPPQNLILAIAI